MLLFVGVKHKVVCKLKKNNKIDYKKNQVIQYDF